MLVPMKFSLDDADAHHAVVHLRQRLIEPRIRASAHERWNVDQIEVGKFYVEFRDVFVLCFHLVILSCDGYGVVRCVIYLSSFASARI